MAARDVSNNCVSHGEETDSADETFVFTKKRKPDAFFVDLTDEADNAKKLKTDMKGLANGREFKFGTSAEKDIEIVKVVPGDSSSSDLKLPKRDDEESSTSEGKSVVEVKVPQLFSPPHVVHVVDANFKLSGEVVDLTKVVREENSNTHDTDKVQVQVVEDSPDEKPPSPLYQNQLKDRKVAEKFDNILWLGKKNMYYFQSYTPPSPW